MHHPSCPARFGHPECTCQQLRRPAEPMVSDRAIMLGAWAFVLVIGLLAAYGVGALMGAWPAAPWSQAANLAVEGHAGDGSNRK